MIDIASLHPSYLTDENGKRVSVQLPIETFRKLLEDYEDLLLLAESAKDQEPYMSHEDFMEELKAEGML